MGEAHIRKAESAMRSSSLSAVLETGACAIVLAGVAQGLRLLLSRGADDPEVQGMCCAIALGGQIDRDANGA